MFEPPKTFMTGETYLFVLKGFSEVMLLVREWVQVTTMHRMCRFDGQSEVNGTLDCVICSNFCVAIITWIKEQKLYN